MRVVEKELIFPYGAKVTQIELVYKNKVKPSERPIIESSWDSFRLFLGYWSKSKIDLLEEFKCMYLNTANRVLGISDISRGGIASTTVDTRLVIAIALKLNATAMIVAHNHPSGRNYPSDADKDFTRSLELAARVMRYTLLDHIIVCRENYFSFADHELLSLHRDNKYLKRPKSN